MRVSSMKSTTITSDYQPLASVILSQKTTRNSENLLELQSLRKESERVSIEILILPSPNVIGYTKTGSLEVYQEMSKKSWLI